MNNNKIALIGDGGVGKTTLVRKLQTGEFRKKYIATLGVEVHPIKNQTNYGYISHNIWDCAGQEKFGGLRDGYYIGSNAVIVMFDKTSLVTFKNVTTWIDSYRNIAPNTPIILCGNKCDINQQKVTTGAINQYIQQYANQHKIDITYVEISCKTGYNIDLLVETLTNELMHRTDIVLCDNNNKPTYAIPNFA